VLLDAIAEASGTPPASVRRAVMLSGSPAAVAAAALGEGAAGLARFSIEMFRPLDPMLAQSAGGLDEALAKLGRAALELKLDGARVQIHRVGDDVRVFSRQRNDVTASVPELVEAARALPVRSVILDGEAIALRPDGTPLPFQVSMRRFGRRLDVERLRAELPLASFFFDCLALDDRPLIDLPYAERVAALDSVVPEAWRVERHLAADAGEAAAFVDRVLGRGHEGVMVKSLDAPYEAGRRGASWLKVKPAHTLDLVVLAVEWGSGRRSGWLSNLHLGARDPATGGFAMLGKTFKGMTDEMLAWQTAKLSELTLGRERHVVHVRPELVVEVAFDGVQASPRYPSGMALRFARVVRYRPDKSAADADTVDAVRRILAR
jgi:DNA ligase-1